MRKRRINLETEDQQKNGQTVKKVKEEVDELGN